MSRRVLASISAVAVMVWVVSLGAVPAAAQTAAPRTVWGDPDVQGVWDFGTITPLERPDHLAGREFLTEEEAATLGQEAVDRNVRLWEQPPERTVAGGDIGGYNNFWNDRGTTSIGTLRTSLVIDPPDGRIPPTTRAAQARAAARAAVRQGITEGPEDRSLSERCLLRGNAGPPMLPAGYNNFVQLFQTPDYVVIFTEQIHDARIISMDGRPHLPPSLRQWMGDSRGRWDGDTLVVETVNFSEEKDFRGGGREHAPCRTLHACGHGDAPLRVHGHRSSVVHPAVDRSASHAADAQRDIRIRLSRGELRDGEHAQGCSGERAVSEGGFEGRCCIDVA